MSNYYIPYHIHSMISNTITIDSTTHYKEYIDLCVKNNIPVIAFSEHGSVMNWIEKKHACDKAGIKYIHGQEFYLTTTLDEKLKETFHIGLYSRNNQGVAELNRLSSLAFNKEDNHYYYKPRISINELMNTSENIIITTACLQSILWKKRDDEELIKKILSWMGKNNNRCFLEIQYHTDKNNEQVEYNKLLYKWSKEYNIKLIAGTDTHSSTQYKSECRKILQLAKDMFYGDEDEFDLTFKTYDELVVAFSKQNALPKEVYIEAIENTKLLDKLTEPITLDYSFKYPKLYKDEDRLFKEVIKHKLADKVKNNVITVKEIEKFKPYINEEYRVFKKLGMISFMLFMSELITWCHKNDIPTGYCRGSVGGSTIAYILDIIDLNPVKWKTIFSRFANEDRTSSLGDIDIDFAPSDREKVYDYIINRFGSGKTCYILTTNTVSDKGTIDEICRAYKNELKNLDKKEKLSIHEEERKKYLTNILKTYIAKDMKTEYEVDEDKARTKYPEVFKYFDGIKNTVISKGIHPAGIVAANEELDSIIGTFYNDDKTVSQVNMDEIHKVNLVKYDILGLKNIGIIKDTYKLIESKYLKSHEINWNDEGVWDDIITHPAGIFQFEGQYAFSLLKKFKPQSINDMSLVNASLRPSGASYRDRLINKEFNNNPSKEIDELLAENKGFLVFQEDTLKFLINICGFTGSHADNVRRAIGGKLKNVLDEEIPKILDGYCNYSNKPREIAEEEAKQFLQILSDSSDYQFGYNHSTGYSMIGYTCGMLRYYYPLEFTTAFLNNAETEEDKIMGYDLIKLKNIKIKPIKFRYSSDKFTMDESDNSIYQGIGSIKYMNDNVGKELYNLKDKEYNTFIDLLVDLTESTSCNTRQIEILIKLDFFSEFGRAKRLIDIFNEFNEGENKYKKTYVDKTKARRLELLYELENNTPDEDFNMVEKIQYQLEYLGYINTTIPEIPNDIAVVTKIERNQWGTYFLDLYRINNGETETLKMYKNTFINSPVNEFDVIKTIEIEDKQKRRKINDKWVNLDEREKILLKYARVVL